MEPGETRCRGAPRNAGEIGDIQKRARGETGPKNEIDSRLAAALSYSRGFFLFEIDGSYSPRKSAPTIYLAQQNYSTILRRVHQTVEHNEDFPGLNADFKVK